MIRCIFAFIDCVRIWVSFVSISLVFVFCGIYLDTLFSKSYRLFISGSKLHQVQNINNLHMTTCGVWYKNPYHDVVGPLHGLIKKHSQLRAFTARSGSKGTLWILCIDSGPQSLSKGKFKSMIASIASRVHQVVKGSH